jgi:hypothetical protein
MAQGHLKMTLLLKLNKIDPKIIISLPRSESMKVTAAFNVTVKWRCPVFKSPGDNPIKDISWSLQQFAKLCTMGEFKTNSDLLSLNVVYKVVS